MSEFSVKWIGGAAFAVWVALVQFGWAASALAQAAIECDSGVPASELALFDAHDHLDTSTLEDCNVQHDSTLHLLVRLPRDPVSVF